MTLNSHISAASSREGQSAREFPEKLTDQPRPTSGVLSESPPSSHALEVERIRYAYGNSLALEEVSLHVEQGEIFALLGPNGSGKTTLFRILTTLLPLQSGAARVAGHDLAREPAQVRRAIGVVFQSPSLDRKLTARENLIFQGRMYGLHGGLLARRVGDVLDVVGLTQRAHELVERFSGGMQRRLEIAKALLHEPKVLLLDEPTTGLDPTARREVMEHLQKLKATRGVTSVLTTHLMEEADACDRVAILDRGRMVVVGPPDDLKRCVGQEVVLLISPRPEELRSLIAERFGMLATVSQEELRIEVPMGLDGGAPRLLVQIVEAFRGLVESARLGRPTLEDVFFHFTGKRLIETQEASSDPRERSAS
ncbi:MAG: ATP-binding cassette domain-containing protein [Candidatus Sumerlaea chitinivorans]|nr:ATP-binding cassette domain-containing protein [Candidatus Sumerlaea chitinivorans]